MSESAPRRVDVRVGSATDGLTPISMAERSLAASPVQRRALTAVLFAGIALLSVLFAVTTIVSFIGPADDSAVAGLKKSSMTKVTRLS